ncbi:hypothetical protein [Mesorhizobium sp. M0478]|uniref:hypothetical protein n=1 Tax=Mesorhizobium sp. M0478 TaxID=2956947 RepID=UPI00333B930D
MVDFVAVKAKGTIRSAITAWRNAFRTLGTTDHGFSDHLVWVEASGIWLNVRGWDRDEGFRYWNGLGDRLGGKKDRNLIVEVNPPDGEYPGRFQGLVARDNDRRLWLLHAGEMNMGTKRIHLSNNDRAHGLTPAIVAFSNGTKKPYYRVAQLGDSQQAIVDQTKTFVDACRLVRINSATESEMALGVAQQARIFEEALGRYLVGPQEAKWKDRTHAKIWHALKSTLEAKGVRVANERVSSLGPDLFTYEEAVPRLFEIKTAAGSSDYLKAIGQLIVYEKLLKRGFSKMIVVPKELPAAMKEILESLGIGVVTYQIKKGVPAFTGL